MRLKKVKNAKERIEASNYYVSMPENKKGMWKNLFNNDNPIHIEIGMGKGKFIINMAKTFPNINFIGIEKYDSVMVKAISTLENEDELHNLKLVLIDAENIESIFSKEIERVYLNFSDPWPKSKHEKRRLTSGIFLQKYESIFKDRKEIIQKTDNLNFFEFSLESLKNNGYEVKFLTYDLYSEEGIFNIPTEYEEKFNEAGIKINKLEAFKE